MKETDPRKKRFFNNPIPNQPTPINDVYYDILVEKYGETLVKAYYKPMGVRG